MWLLLGGMVVNHENMAKLGSNIISAALMIEWLPHFPIQELNGNQEHRRWTNRGITPPTIRMWVLIKHGWCYTQVDDLAVNAKD